MKRGWYLDPWRRCERRWYDGASWTGQVRHGGRQFDEPSFRDDATGQDEPAERLLPPALPAPPPSTAPAPWTEVVTHIERSKFASPISPPVVETVTRLGHR
ncbi:MAG: DUF2510 domain-containing protein [Ilumatobacteraceae bacterium]